MNNREELMKYFLGETCAKPGEQLELDLNMDSSSINNTVQFSENEDGQLKLNLGL